jgi:hypothetical protein
MGSDQDIDTAGTEADDESAKAKALGFGDHAPAGRDTDQPGTAATGSNPKSTLPDEQAADDDKRGAVRDRGDKGGVS